MRRTLSLAVAGFLIAGCRLTTGAAAVVTVSIETSRSTVRAGEPLAMTLVATNEGEAAGTVDLPYCLPSVEARDARGELVGHTRLLPCALILYAPVLLAPGQSVRHDAVWVARTGPAIEQGPVAPGTYRLRAANFVVRGGTVRYADASVLVTE